MFTLKFKICIHWRFTTWKANMMIKSIHKCNGKYVHVDFFPHINVFCVSAIKPF